MAIGFPNNPADGDEYVSPSGVRYVRVASQSTWRPKSLPLNGIPPRQPQKYFTSETALAAHDQTTRDFYGIVDATITFPSTLKAGWERRDRHYGASGTSLFFAAGAGATVIPFLTNHTEVVQTTGGPGGGGWITSSCISNDDGNSAVIAIIGTTTGTVTS